MLSSPSRRLDHAIDLLLLLIGILSAAILQYATALEDISFTTFSMRFLFIPIVAMTLIWLLNRIFSNNQFRMFARVFVWFFGLFVLFVDVLFFVVVSFMREIVTSRMGNIFVPASSAVLGFFALMISTRIERDYGYRGHTEIYIYAYLTAIFLLATTTILSLLS